MGNCFSDKARKKKKNQGDSDSQKGNVPLKKPLKKSQSSDQQSGYHGNDASPPPSIDKPLLDRLKDQRVGLDAKAAEIADIAGKVVGDVLLEGLGEAVPWAKPLTVVIKGIIGAYALAGEVQEEMKEFRDRITKLSVIVHEDLQTKKYDDIPQFAHDMEEFLKKCFAVVLECMLKSSSSKREKLWNIVMAHSHKEEIARLYDELERLQQDYGFAQQVSMTRSLANLLEAQERQRRTGLVETLKQYHVGFLKYYNDDAADYEEQTDMLNKLNVWFKREDNSGATGRVFLLSADQGSGKTMLAAAACRHFRSDVLHAFFFEYADVRRSSLKAMILGVAFQLYQMFEEKYISLIPGNCLDNVETISFEFLRDNLITNHLETLNKLSDKNMLLVLDGADECDFEYHMQLANFIKTFNEKAPSWLYLFVTTRPIPTHVDLFKISGGGHVLIEGIVGNGETLRKYVNRGLSKLCETGDETKEAVEVLCNDGVNFRYTQCVLNEVHKQHQHEKVNVSHIEAVKKNLPSLSEFYRADFQMLKDKVNDVAKFRKLLAVLVAAREPLSLSFFNYYISMLNLAEEADELFSIISRHVAVKYDEILFSHKSVRDWLIEFDNQNSMNIVKDGHLEISKLCITALDALLHDTHVACTAVLEYAINHFVYHYVEVDGFQKNLTEVLCSLKYIERKLQVPRPNMATILLKDYYHEHVSEATETKVSLQCYLKHQKDKQLIQAYRKFIAINAAPIQQCPHLVYQYAANYPIEVDDLSKQANQWIENNQVWTQVLRDPHKLPVVQASLPDYIWAMDVCSQLKFLVCLTSDVNDYETVNDGAKLHVLDLESLIVMHSLDLDNYLQAPIVKWKYFKYFSHCKVFLKHEEPYVIFGSRRYLARIHQNQLVVEESNLHSDGDYNILVTCCDVIANLVVFGLSELNKNMDSPLIDVGKTAMSYFVMQDINTGNVLRTFNHESGMACCCKFSENGKSILSYSQGDNIIKTWDIDRGEQEEATTQVKESSCIKFDILEDQSLVYQCIDEKRRTKLFIVKDGCEKEIRKDGQYDMNQIIGLTYIPSIGRVAVLEPGDNRWESKSVKVLLVNPWSTDLQNSECVVDDTNQHYMAYLGGALCISHTVNSDSATCLVYGVGKNINAHVLADDAITSAEAGKSSKKDTFYNCAFTHDSRTLILQMINKSQRKMWLELIDTATGKSQESSEPVDTVEMSDGDFNVFTLLPVLSSDDTKVLADSGRTKIKVGRSKLYVWFVKENKMVKLNNPSIEDGNHHVKSFCFSPDGSTILVSYRQFDMDSIDAFRAESAEFIKTYNGRGTYMLYTDESSKQIATYEDKGKLSLWNWETGSLVEDAPSVSVVKQGVANRDKIQMPSVVHHGAGKVALLQVDRRHIRMLLFDISNHTVQELPGEEVEDPDFEYLYPYKYVLSFSADRDGSLLATSLLISSVTLWNTRTLSKRVVFNTDVQILSAGAWLTTRHLLLLQDAENDSRFQIVQLKDGVIENYVTVTSDASAILSGDRSTLAVVKRNVGLALYRIHGYETNTFDTTSQHIFSLK